MAAQDFEAFVHEHQDMVYTTALRLLGREVEAEDVAQETFLRAFERYGELAGGNPGGWLRAVATNLSLNHLERHRKRWRLFSELESADGAGLDETLPAPPDDDAPEALRAALDQALLELPDAQRVPLVLFHFEDLSYEQIARRLGASLGKIKTDIHRGRLALRQTLGEDCA